jgi:hypothetical protein
MPHTRAPAGQRRRLVLFAAGGGEGASYGNDCIVSHVVPDAGGERGVVTREGDGRCREDHAATKAAAEAARATTSRRR